MAMNFFEHQDRARRRTWLLVLYFLLAVVLITLAINAALFYAVRFTKGLSATGDTAILDLGAWLQQPWWLVATAVTLLVIIGGSLATLLRLRGGGRAVAKMVGARRVRRSTDDLGERRLINVVEEMSIASGTPVPALYVMDEESGINAFVAGFKPTETVMVVTRGAIEQLSRDELQGVVAHEYSHVLNGDMRLNLRLMGVLAGILVIGQLGGFMLRSLRYAGRSRSRGGGSAVMAMLAMALALFAIGYLGLFFGRLIKAAISRQREFLADASAVQFTRNPDGIAGALWKIKQHVTGSLLVNAHAEDMSHMCFGQGLRFSRLFATHPPLDKRIAVIAPTYSARMAARRLAEPAPEPTAAPSSPVPAAASGFAGGEAGETIRASSRDMTSSVGNPTAVHAAYARELHASIPSVLLEALRVAEDAAAAVYALLLARAGTDELPTASALLEEHAGEDAASRAVALRPVVAGLGSSGRLPMIDLAISSLKELSPEQRARFLTAAAELAGMDQRISLFEFVLLTLLRHHLVKGAERPERVRYTSFDEVISEIRLVLSVLARAGGDPNLEKTFAVVMGTFQEGLSPVPMKDVSAAALNAALEKLAALSPLLKEPVITACADCVLHDGRVRPAEAELVRVVAATLDCPMPPLLPERR